MKKYIDGHSRAVAATMLILGGLYCGLFFVPIYLACGGNFDFMAKGLSLFLEPGFYVWCLALSVFLFWIFQLFDLLSRDPKDFESHTHKPVWFLVVLLGQLVGSIWYYRWKREVIEARATATLLAECEVIEQRLAT